MIPFVFYNFSPFRLLGILLNFSVSGTLWDPIFGPSGLLFGPPAFDFSVLGFPLVPFGSIWVAFGSLWLSFASVYPSFASLLPPWVGRDIFMIFLHEVSTFT